MTTFTMPAYISNQLSKEYIALDNNFLGGADTPATLKLVDVDFNDETQKVMMEIKIYWQHCLVTQEVLPYEVDKTKDPSWTYGKIHLKEWKPMSQFTEQEIAYFRKLRAIWDEILKTKKVHINDCPWLVPSSKGVAFNLEKQGDLWRGSNINLAGGIWAGRGNKLQATEQSKVHEAFSAPVFSFNTGTQPVVPSIPDRVVEEAGDQIPI